MWLPCRTSSFLRVSSRIQKRSSCSSTGSMGLVPRFSPSTLPNVTVCETRFAMGGDTLAAAVLIIIGRSAETAAKDESSFRRCRPLGMWVLQGVADEGEGACIHGGARTVETRGNPVLREEQKKRNKKKQEGGAPSVHSVRFPPSSSPRGRSYYRVISYLSRYDLVQFAPQNTQRR